MKKIVLVSIALMLLVSCGPHRMKCGARGICDSNEKNNCETFQIKYVQL